jgi:hypothetical protein
MEQSRLEISAFIASLSASAAAAEKPAEKAAVTPPAPVVAPAVSAAVTNPVAISSAAAHPVYGDHCCAVRVAEAPAAGAEILLDAAAVSPTTAVEFGSADDAAVRSAAATISAGDAYIAVGPVFDINAEANQAVASRTPSPVSAASTPPSGSGSPAPASPAAKAIAATAGDPPPTRKRTPFMSLQRVRERFYGARRRLVMLSSLQKKPLSFLLERELLGAEI